MTGRGSGRLMRPSSNPSVTIGISVSVSPPTLSASSTEPFYVVVTAWIQSSPHQERPITLCTHLSPLDSLCTRAFENIKCTSNEAKFMEIWPRGWPQYVWDVEDMGEFSRYITIPPRNQGTFSVRHEVPPDAIRSAKVEQGERYRVNVTDKCLGTVWWTFGALEELEGMRLRMWRSKAEEEAERAEEEMFGSDFREEMEQERRYKYGDMPSTLGEDPDMLAMVREVGEVELKVV